MANLSGVGEVTLDLAQSADLARFRSELQDAFALAVVDTFGSVDDGPIPSDADVAESFNAPNARGASHSGGRKLGWRSGPEDKRRDAEQCARFFLCSPG